jgi:hypothetical protein
VPSKGLSEVLLISISNFLVEGPSYITLSSVRTSAAGLCFSANRLCHSGCDSGSQGEPVRYC